MRGRITRQITSRVERSLANEGRRAGLVVRWLFDGISDRVEMAELVRGIEFVDRHRINYITFAVYDASLFEFEEYDARPLVDSS